MGSWIRVKNRLKNLTSKSAFTRGLDGSENRVILELKFRVEK